MKKISSALLLLLCIFTMSVKAQTADEIASKYVAQIGGAEKWKAVKSFKMEGVVKTQGLELPMVQTAMAPNLMKMSINFQGKELVQQAFDGKDSWATSFMTMKQEKKSSEESYNMIDEASLLDPFIDYAARGYSISLEGSEAAEGVDCYKVKMTRKPVKVDGKEEENFSFYYFDKENNVPIAMKSTVKSGEGKGTVIETVFSNYQEVDGLFFPFEINIKSNGATMATIQINKVNLNEALEASSFKFPE